MFNRDNSDGSVAGHPQVCSTARQLAPTTDWGEMSDSDHFVQFYESDDFLLNSLSSYVGMGLSMDDACIVVATRPHRESLDKRLEDFWAGCLCRPRLGEIHPVGRGRDAVAINGRRCA